jgi:hypothetical protein
MLPEFVGITVVDADLSAVSGGIDNAAHHA